MSISMRLGLLGLILLLAGSLATAQQFHRKQVDVPKVDPTAITIDGKMDEAVWTTAAHADLVTATGFEIFTNKYYRESLTEPDYKQYIGRMLWSKDTLYVFIHIQEVVNDSTDLFWKGKWTGDQLFVSLSNRLGVNMMGWYDGNVYAAPDGPYHFLVLGDRVTLNDSLLTNLPGEFQQFPTDTARVYNAANFGHFATHIDKPNGIWDVEMAIYNPNVAAGSNIGFNIGGSTGSTFSDTVYGDAYAYYTWQPCVVDSPYAQPNVPEQSDPGFYNLANSNYWAQLNFTPGLTDYARKQVTVPMVEPTEVTVDGKMNEPFWANAAHANLVTATGFEIFTNKYYRESLTEPDYKQYIGRMLWSKDTLYVFIHIQEVVNDSTDLFWKGKWTGDQLFVSLSNRLGVNMMGWYDGNVYAAPDGPYHFLVLGDRVTLNDSLLTNLPGEFQQFPTDTARVYNAANFGHFATHIDKPNGIWDVEMAIYNPNVDAGSNIGFNIGGSTGSTFSDTAFGDAYAYYTWQPCVVDSPYAQPNVPEQSDPGFYNLANSNYWASLTFDPTHVVSGVNEKGTGNLVPNRFTLSQNYPNPFNPSTTIRYALPHAGKVTLKVYNLLGQTVGALVDEQKPAGEYQLRFNAQSLASGLYFYRLAVDGKVVETKKMMLLK